MFRLTIRDVLWLTVVVALVIAVWFEYTRGRRLRFPLVAESRPAQKVEVLST